MAVEGLWFIFRFVTSGSTRSLYHRTDISFKDESLKVNNPIYTVLGLHSFRTSAVRQTSRKQNRLQGFKPALMLVLCFYSFMQKAMSNQNHWGKRG